LIKKSPYEMLGLKDNFTFEDIKKAYRQKIRENPPEQNPQAFSEISDAYDILTNEEYFFKDAPKELYALVVDIKVDESPKRETSRYLKNIFEVPFQI